MAELIAAVIAGVPARILNGVLSTVRERHPDVLVLRGAGAKLYSSERPAYPANYIDEVERQAIDAVFGQSARPAGFCRNPQRACAQVETHKVNCGAANGLSCGRKKPDHFVIFYQESDEQTESIFVDHFRNSALMVRIPAECYDKAESTGKFLSESIPAIAERLKPVVNNISGGAPSTLLPVRNFGKKELRKLVRRAVRGEIGKSHLKDFRSAFFREGKYFLGRSKLAFEPTIPATAHGVAGAATAPVAALASHFRAGCLIGDFHWDVSPTGDSGWGATQIECGIGGMVKPQSAHVNLLIDDCIRQ